MRVLVAEDEARIAQSLAHALEMAGFVVEIASDGEDAWFRGDSEDFDAIILDLGLPTLDGLTTIKRWRRAKRLMPVLILTARGNWEERVEGIEAGADDYVAKPFRMEEVVARVRAIVRRAAGHASTRFEVDGLALDTQTMSVTLDGNPVSVTPMEYKLLHYLLHHQGEIVPQIRLIEHLYAQDFDRDSNSVEVLVGRLRKKLGRPVIHNRRGFGYYVGEVEP
jgi:DNA-binding response OmpR family regulator